LEPRRVRFIEAAKRAWMPRRMVTESREVERESEYKKPWLDQSAVFLPLVVAVHLLLVLKKRVK